MASCFSSKNWNRKYHEVTILMGNSSEELKEIVKNVTLSNEEDGIY